MRESSHHPPTLGIRFVPEVWSGPYAARAQPVVEPVCALLVEAWSSVVEPAEALAEGVPGPGEMYAGRPVVELGTRWSSRPRR